MFYIKREEKMLIGSVRKLAQWDHAYIVKKAWDTEGVK